MSVRPSVYLQVHFRRKGGSRLRCSPPSPSLFLLDPPKSTPSPDHGKSLNPTLLPSLLPLAYTVVRRFLSIPPFALRFSWVARLLAWSLGPAVDIHPSSSCGDPEREREGTRVYRVNLDILRASQTRKYICIFNSCLTIPVALSLINPQHALKDAQNRRWG